MCQIESLYVSWRGWTCFRKCGFCARPLKCCTYLCIQTPKSLWIFYLWCTYSTVFRDFAASSWISWADGQQIEIFLPHFLILISFILITNNTKRIWNLKKNVTFVPVFLCFRLLKLIGCSLKNSNFDNYISISNRL